MSLNSVQSYHGDPRLKEMVEEAQRRYASLPLIERIKHDIAQQASFVRGQLGREVDGMRVTLALSDVEELLRRAQSTPAKEEG